MRWLCVCTRKLEWNCSVLLSLFWEDLREARLQAVSASFDACDPSQVHTCLQVLHKTSTLLGSLLHSLVCATNKWVMKKQLEHFPLFGRSCLRLFLFWTLSACIARPCTLNSLQGLGNMCCCATLMDSLRFVFA